LSPTPTPQPHQQRIEGPVLEDLLSDVRARFGPSATIVEANRLRRGGVAGFFARERYEVVVDAVEPEDAAGDDGDTALPATVESGPTSLLDLVDQASAEEAGPISTQGGRFAEVLARIARDTAERDQLPAGNDDEVFEAWPAAGPVPAIAPPSGDGSSTDALPLATTGTIVSAPTEAAVDATGGHPFAIERPLAARAAQAFAAAAEVSRNLAGETPVHATPIASPAPPSPPAAVTVIPPPVVRTTALVPAPEVTGVTSRRRDLDLTPLLRAGFPAEVVARVGDAPDVHHALRAALEDLPRAPMLPDLPAAVIAVVGRRADAIELARCLAGELELNPDTVAVASTQLRGSAVARHRRIDSLEVAAERRMAWRRRKRPVLVAVEATTLEDVLWASYVLDALEPAMTLATVEATTKPEDVLARVELLQGVDALGVTGLDETTSPASVLQTGIPVGWLDGQFATVARWRAVLGDRQAA
jgi:hypothetical protein